MYLTLIILAFATAAISMTISKAKVTAPIRDWALENIPWVGKMLSCPYCVSHWAAAGLVLWEPVALNFFIAVFAVIALATIIEGLMLRLMFMHEMEIDRLNTELDEARASQTQLADALRGMMETEES